MILIVCGAVLGIGLLLLIGYGVGMRGMPRIIAAMDDTQLDALAAAVAQAREKRRMP
jgi:hypothetical protein